MELQLFSRDNQMIQVMGDDSALLGSYPVDDGMRIHVSIIQGNLKGESVVAAIFPSRMEVSYTVPPDFFVTKPAKQFHWAWVAFPTWT